MDSEDDENDGREQINVRVSTEQKEMMEEYIDQDDTGQNTLSDLIRTATMNHIRDGATQKDIDELDAITTQLSRIESSVSEVSNSVQELQDTSISTDQLGDTVDARVRNLLYTTIINNEAVEGVTLNDD